jgi:hypothetical protein
VRSSGADLALALFAGARFSMATAGPASAGFVGLIGFEDRSIRVIRPLRNFQASVLSTSLGHWVEGIMAASSICHALWHHRCRRMPYLVNAASASSYSMSVRVMG